MVLIIEIVLNFQFLLKYGLILKTPSVISSLKSDYNITLKKQNNSQSLERSKDARKCCLRCECYLKLIIVFGIFEKGVC